MVRIKVYLASGLLFGLFTVPLINMNTFEKLINSKNGTCKR